MVYAAAGDRTRAGSLRDIIGPDTISVLANDISVTSLATFVDCPGLSVPVDGRGVYQIDGYIAYSSDTTADIQFVFSSPPDVFANATFAPQFQTATGGVGPIEMFRFIHFTNVNTQGAAGIASGSMACMPHGFIFNYNFGGAVQLQFAQNASTATTTTVLAGSWLRAQSMGYHDL